MWTWYVCPRRRVRRWPVPVSRQLSLSCVTGAADARRAHEAIRRVGGGDDLLVSSGVHIVVSSSLAGSAIGVDGSTPTPPQWSAVLSRYTSLLRGPLVGHTLRLISGVERRGEGGN